MQSCVCTLIRPDANQPWGFRLQGGRDYGTPLTVQKINPRSIADQRGLRPGDTILQIGKERTVDMNHENAQNAILRSANRLDLVVLRPASQDARQHQQREQDQIRAVVHRQTYNSPLPLYSKENIADALTTQSQVLTNGTVGVGHHPKMSSPVVKRSEVYRMVHEEESGKSSQRNSREFAESQTLQSQSFLRLQRSLDDTDSTSSSTSASPTYMGRQAPAPPPKPGAQQQQQQQQQYRQPQSPQQQQQYRQPQSPQQQQQYRQPQSPQQQQQQYRPPQQHVQQQQAKQPPQPQQHVQAKPQPQQTYSSNYYPQQQQQQTYNSYAQPQKQQHQQPATRQQQPPQYQPYPQQPQTNSANYNSAPRQTSTFQSVIPTESSYLSSSVDGGPGGNVNWSPSTGRKPIWPPAKSQAGIVTSSQSVKWGEGTSSKKFIWPPPKDHVAIREEYDEDGEIVYRQVPTSQPKPSRVYISPRSPARLAAEAWEPYSKEQQQDLYHLHSGPNRRLRRFNDIFTPNSTRLPPTYRAPPGTQHVEFVYE